MTSGVDWPALEFELLQRGPDAGLPAERRLVVGTARVLLRHAEQLPADVWHVVLRGWVADYSRRWS